MGGSSKQTIGYKYFAGLMVVIGNPIEKFLGINADNRGWMAHKDNDNQDKSLMVINNPNLFGGSNQEGGWVGVVDIHHGKDTQEQNQYLAKNIDPDISAYPNLSYLVFRGYDSATQSENLNKGFEVVSMSGMLKDFMLWVKRTRIKNDGSIQWYEKNENGDIVCEIDARESSTNPDEIQPFKMTLINTQTGFATDNTTNSLDIAYPKNEPFYVGYKGPFGYYYYNQGSEQDNYKLFSRVDILKFGNFICTAKILLEINAREFSYEFSGGYKILNTDYSERTSDPKTKFFEILIEFDADSSFAIITNVKGGIVSYESGARNLGGVINIDFISLKQKETRIGIESQDINPIHKIREIITDYTAMNKPESSINDSNFKIAADIIWEEKLGISWCIQEKSCKDALDELLYHIEAGLRINRQTGLYEVILFRDDLIDLDNSISFNESNIKSINFDIANLDESISSINVSYYDRELIKDSSFLLYENGLERTRGFSISENIDFPYFMNRRNAELVANWKLKQLSSPSWKGSFKTGIIEARKINKYDVVRLSWKSKGLIDLPVRILNINLGDSVNNTVSFDFVEVIPYSNIEYSSTIADPPIETNLPPQFNSNIAIEMPYFEAVQRFTQTQVDLELSNSPELGYLMASAARPQSNSLNAQLYTDKATGIYANMSKVGVVDYCPSVYLSESISRMDNVLNVIDIDYPKEFGAPRFMGATKGSWVLLNNEIMVYESFDSEKMQIKVKRGALDTIPQIHTSGIIFFCDEFSGIDSNQYVYGETVKYQVLTTTPSSMQKLELGNTKELQFNSRAIKPYPPANVMFNGIYYPQTIVISSDILITWSYRNRIQQTSENIIGFYDDDITTESNVSYSIEVFSENNLIFNVDAILTNNFSIDKSLLIPNKPHIFKIWSVRDGFRSYQTFEHGFFVESVSLILSATVSKDSVSGSTVSEANINVNVDESLSSNFRYDGSNITGKTLPNSSITINIED